jgi:restriction system protein
MVFQDIEDTPSFFVNRAAELEWIANRSNDRRARGEAIEITGPPGIGKTALVRQFTRGKERSEHEVLSLGNQGQEIDLDRLDYLLRDGRLNLRTVIIDNAPLGEEELERLTRKVFNWKRIRELFLTNREPKFKGGVQTINLGPLDQRSTLELFRLLSRERKLERIPDALLTLSEGHPLAIHLMANLLQTHDPHSLVKLLQGSVYSLKNELLVPRRELITSVVPKLVIVNEEIIERLKARPEDIHQIGHRKFEELVAELLDDMDFDVELTQATRDGGRDVLAYWNSPVGRLLCLVEVKKYRPDRTVGIQLVKNLYGTLMDEQATSAVLVTTSDFSPDARKFEDKHKWQLALRNYTDLVQWIQNYKKPKTAKIIRS